MAAVRVAAIVFSASAMLGVELGVERLAGRFGLGRLLLARLVGERLRAAARIGQRLLVGRDGGVGLRP